MTNQRGSRPAGRWIAILVLLLIGVPFLLRLELLTQRGFNPDEFEHLHFAWSVAQGQVPYRDYFDHHTPWLHLALAPLVERFDVAASGAEAVQLVIAARRVMWVGAGLILLLVGLIGASYRNRGTGLVAALLLANAGVFLSKSLEVRPDVPAALLVCAAVLCALRGERSPDGGLRALLWLLASGLAWGSAIFFTQKVLLLIPGVVVAAAWPWLDRRTARGPAETALRALALAVGAALPVVATLAAFFRLGALDDFIRCTLLVNTGWPGPRPGPFLWTIAREDAAFVVLLAIGVPPALRPIVRRVPGASVDTALVFPLIAGCAGLAWLTYVSFQYFLLLLPLAAVLAADALVRGVAWVADLWLRKRRGGGTAGADLWAGILAVVLLALSAQPLLRFRQAFGRGSWAAQQGIEFIVRNCAPWDSALDGFAGWGFVRPAPFYYPFQHRDVLRLQSEQERQGMLSALRDGSASPKVVLWNRHLIEGLTPDARAFIERHYVRLGPDPIRVRPFDNGAGWWRDLGRRYFGWQPGSERSPHMYFLDGWRDPALEDGRPVRQSRTGRSQLIVPIRGPRDLTFAFHGRASAGAHPFDLALLVNRKPVGRVVASPEWREYGFDVPREMLHPGFNEVELRCTADVDPGVRAEIAFEWLDLRPRGRE
jgi:hypothetical protein